LSGTAVQFHQANPPKIVTQYSIDAPPRRSSK
jgi:hypothetical protein